MKSFLVGLIGLLFVIQTSMALQCYQCNSIENGDCVEPDKGKLINCSEAPSTSTILSAFKAALAKIEIPDPNPVTFCTKLTYTEGDKTHYVRECTIKPHQKDICAELAKNYTVKFCEFCDTDSCNSALTSSTQIWLPLILMPALAGVLKTFV